VLGVLCFGTGGDFRRTIGAAKALAEGAAQLRGRETTTIDAGRLRYVDHDGQPRLRHFANIASFGLSGLVDRYVNESSKRLGGRLTFALATIKALRRFEPQRVRLTVDDQPPVEVAIQTVAVANGQYFGGGMQIAPQARLDDGLFDVVILEPFSMKEMLLRGTRVYKGTHLELEYVSLTRGRRVTATPLDANTRVLLDVDGETPGCLPASFELLPAALRLKTPAVGARD
jgi:diacylglycerol kinase family enzyme